MSDQFDECGSLDWNGGEGRRGCSFGWVDDGVCEGADEEYHVIDAASFLEIPRFDVEKVGRKGKGGRGGHAHEWDQQVSLRDKRCGLFFEE